MRSLRWQDYARFGTYRAFVEVDDMQRPIHPVAFSTPEEQEAFVARLRTAIAKAGGPRFSVVTSDEMHVVEPDLSDPVTAAVATRARSVGRRVSLRADG
ncbi:hypothetical protein [Neoaquamicrobium sediminum]|uniref:hypothetical protein n=1 Tax=Neoaquamicrobium sediminum TaxID=1849104 RepID=UPI0015636EAA|nr:hypothetical protein [Mesorhizobium sediminum]NRC57322.1 hypothetical protein [Mesorhizobium sediminum]